MELALTAIYALVFILIIYKSAFFNLDGISKKITLGAFLIKVLFSFLIWAIYTYYYTDRTTSDIFKYFDDATILYEVFKESPVSFFKIVAGINTDSPELKPYLEKLNYWYKPYDYGIFNDNRTIIRFNSIVYLFSFGYYHIHALVMCFLSFIGLTAIYRVFIPILKNKSKELFFAVFLLPSVLFWGSGVLKEGLLIFGLGLLIYCFSQLLTRFKLGYFIGFILATGLLLITKVYVLLVAVPGLISWLVIRLSGNSKIGLKFIVINLIVLSIGLNLKYINPNYDILKKLQFKQKDFIDVARDTKAGSYIELGKLDTTLSSFLSNTPKGLANALFRPHLLDSKSPVILFAAFENVIFILLILLSIFFFKKPGKEEQPLFYFSISFVILLALLIGLVVPVLGAIVRYKVPLLPFFAIIFIILIDKEKLIKKIPFLKFLN